MIDSDEIFSFLDVMDNLVIQVFDELEDRRLQMFSTSVLEVELEMRSVLELGQLENEAISEQIERKQRKM